MKSVKICLLMSVAAFAFGAFADAANALITFSTKGPDTYADGTAVAKGEWYALCWSPNETFGGLTSECTAAVDGDEVMLMAPLATGGENSHCPTVVFQIDSKDAKTGGRYFVYLLDTRGTSGVPSVKGADGKPAIVNGSVAAGAGQAAGAVGETRSAAGAELAKGEGGAVAWGESDTTDVPAPAITSFAIEGDKAVIKVSGLVPSVRYNIFGGAAPDAITTTTLELPISADSNDATFYVDKDEGRFFKVARQPLK